MTSHLDPLCPLSPAPTSPAPPAGHRLSGPRVRPPNSVGDVGPPRRSSAVLGAALQKFQLISPMRVGDSRRRGRLAPLPRILEQHNRRTSVSTL